MMIKYTIINCPSKKERITQYLDFITSLGKAQQSANDYLQTKHKNLKDKVVITGVYIRHLVCFCAYFEYGCSGFFYFFPGTHMCYS